MGRAGLIRKVLLRPRRNGEPHQGADVPVRRPALYRRDEGQSVAPLLLRVGLHPGRGLASPGTEGHRVGSGPGGHHPTKAVQDRRHGARQRAPRRAPDEFGLSLETPLRRSFQRPALLNGAPLLHKTPSPPPTRRPTPRAGAPAEPCPKPTPPTAPYHRSARPTCLRAQIAALIANNAPSRPLDNRLHESSCSVEMWRGGVGPAYLFPALSFAGASLS